MTITAEEFALMTIEQFGQGVARVIADGRIGRPVAARLHAFLSADHGELAQRAADALDLASLWLGDKPVRVEARGSIAEGQFALLAEYANGQNALVVTHLLRDGEPHVDFSVFGTHGTMEHDGDSGDAAAAVVARRARPANDPLLKAIHKTLEEKTAVAV